MSSSEIQFSRLISTYRRLVTKYVAVHHKSGEEVEFPHLASPFSLVASRRQLQNQTSPLDSICSHCTGTQEEEPKLDLTASNSLNEALLRLTKSLKAEEQVATPFQQQPTDYASSMCLQLASLEYAKLLARLTSAKEQYDSLLRRQSSTMNTLLKPGDEIKSGNLENDRVHKRKSTEESTVHFPVKRTRLVWTAELHQCFQKAVEKLGFDKAVPKAILEEMKVEGLTRENVASHLQKYRLQQCQQTTQKPSSSDSPLTQTEEATRNPMPSDLNSNVNVSVAEVTSRKLLTYNHAQLSQKGGRHAMLE